MSFVTLRHGAVCNLRASTPTDHNFIINSWARSYMPTRLAQGDIDPKTYLREQHEIIYQLLDRSKTTVAEEPKSENLLGYIVSGPDSVVHYLYVKLPFRRFGVARALIEEARKSADSGPVVATAWTNAADRYRHLATYLPHRLLEVINAQNRGRKVPEILEYLCGRERAAL